VHQFDVYSQNSEHTQNVDTDGHKKTDVNHAHKKKFKQQNTQVPFFDTLLANDIQCIVSMQNLLYLAAV